MDTGRFSEWLAAFFARPGVTEAASSFSAAARLLVPALAALTVLLCVLPLFRRRTRRVWGTLTMPNGHTAELVSWENLLGRSRSCDAVVPHASAARTHAALIRDGSGVWTVLPIGAAEVRVGGKRVVERRPVKNGDTLTLGKARLTFKDAKPGEDEVPARKSGGSLLLSTLVTVYAAALFLTLAANMREALPLAAPLAYLALVLLIWLSFLLDRDKGMCAETLAFFLTATGLAVATGSGADRLTRQAVCMVAGFVLFRAVLWLMGDLDRVRRLRLPIAGLGLALLAVNLALAKTVLGAKNWLTVAGVTFQPSELVKVCFVLAGSATLDKLYTRRSLWLFMGFAAASLVCLVLMGDLGTAAVFFTAYLVIAFLRSGSFATVLLSVTGAGLAAVMAVSVRPYIGERFASWGRAWELYNDGGYQQTRAMASAASGGLFGLGAGRGWFHNVFAADTDMVFALLAEELGLVAAMLTVAAVLAAALWAVRAAGSGRSTLFTIAAAAAASMLLTQTVLNVFGSLDLLPFTGVTFPFVSRGGTSLIACWGLMGFICAASREETREGVRS